MPFRKKHAGFEDSKRKKTENVGYINVNIQPMWSRIKIYLQLALFRFWHQNQLALVGVYWNMGWAHRIIDDRIEKYESYIVFFSK